MCKLILASVCLFAACGGNTEPTSRVPRIGTYQYSSLLAGSGTLTITRASSDSIGATWNVTGASGGTMTGAAQLGFWNQDAYVLYGTSRRTVGGFTTSTQYAHRIARDNERMTC